MMPVLTLQGISKRFGDNAVLRSVSLAIEKGKVLALLGTSGSGKTTLARLACGILTPDSGKVVVASQEVHGVDAARGLSFMPQESGIWATLSVRSQLSLALHSRRARYSGTDGVTHLAKLGGVEHRLSAHASELSAGELRRVAFLRAVAVTCNLLILDEPFSSVDEATEARMQLVFRQYLEEVGCGVLLITHKFDHAMLLADEAAILHDGTIVQLDEPRKLLRSPTHASVVRVLGGINVWPASVPSDGSGNVDTTVGSFPLPEAFEPRAQETGLAYCVPHDAVRLGEGQPGLKGTVEAAIPGEKVLRVILRCEKDNSSVDIGLPLRPEILESMSSGRVISVEWPANDARVLDDSR